ncbi:hypothetical protein WN943_014705 [Citrus x changshan-huyou]
MKIGEGPSAGYNVNVSWENVMCENGDYLIVWDHTLLSITMEIDPNIISVSARFDAGSVVYF